METQISKLVDDKVNQIISSIEVTANERLRAAAGSRFKWKDNRTLKEILTEHITAAIVYGMENPVIGIDYDELIVEKPFLL
jgi:hypothetical protein